MHQKSQLEYHLKITRLVAINYTKKESNWTQSAWIELGVQMRAFEVRLFTRNLKLDNKFIYDSFLVGVEIYSNSKTHIRPSCVTHYSFLIRSGNVFIFKPNLNKLFLWESFDGLCYFGIKIISLICLFDFRTRFCNKNFLKKAYCLYPSQDTPDRLP